MKYPIVLILAIVAISSEVLAHDDAIKCYACGTQEGQTGIYTGICKDKDDAGVLVTCTDRFKSCIAGVVTVTTPNTTETVYGKNCAETMDYHASGCLHIDETEEIRHKEVCVTAKKMAVTIIMIKILAIKSLYQS